MSVYAADLDGDGNPDVLSASGGDDKIAWYENLGGGTFSDQKVVTTNADGAQSVHTADVDGDGDLDVISGSEEDRKIAWYENTGDGFSSQKVITRDAGGVRAVYADDLDGDSDPDILFASYGGRKIAWHENTEDGFSNQKVITTDRRATSVFTADLDEDGDPDVLSAFLNGKIAWYENTESGFSSQRVIATEAEEPRSVHAADLDGDGDPDVLSASSFDDTIAWYEDLGGGPDAPTDLQASTDGSRIDLSWSPSSDSGLSGYYIYRSKSPFSEGRDARKLNQTPITEVSYVDSVLIGNVEYFYRVAAVNSAGVEGSPSSQSRARTDGPVREDVYKARIVFKIAPGFVQEKTVEEVAQRLKGYVADLNTIFSKSTKRRFIFDPKEDVDVWRKEFPVSGRCNPLDPKYDYWVMVDEDTEFGYSHGGGGGCGIYWNRNAWVTAFYKWQDIWSRAQIGSGGTTEGGVKIERDYSKRQLVTVAHELGHAHGVGSGEYYNLFVVKDKTGTEPNLDIDGRISEVYWGERPAPIVDPMIGGAGSGQSLSELLEKTRFSPLSSALIDTNAACTFSENCSRPADGTSDVVGGWSTNVQPPVPVQVKLRGDEDIVSGCNVTVWNVDTQKHDHQVIAEGETGSNGIFSYTDRSLKHGSAYMMRLAKARCEGYEPVGGWVSVFDVQAAKVLEGGGAENGFRYPGALVLKGLPVASASRYVSESGVFEFEDTGLSLKLSGVGKPDTLTADKYDSPPSDSENIAAESVSDYRFVIGDRSSLEFGSAELRVAVSSLEGIEDPSTVTIYRRDEPGSGTFFALETTVDDNGTPSNISDDTLSATTGSFSEFVLASDNNPLPVELASLSGQADGEGRVQLTWRTASEQGNAGFRVQRRTGTAALWTEVGFVEGAGTITEPQTYRFTDTDLPFDAERLIYRLKQIDTDGTAHLSLEITVQRGAPETRLFAPFPNPTHQQATVRFAVAGAPQEVGIQLYDILGRQIQTVYDSPAEGRIELALDVSDLPSGAYFLRMQVGSQVQTQRMTVVR